MSDNKTGTNFDETAMDLQTNQTPYQAFLIATQQSQAYRKTLGSYQNRVSVSDSAELLSTVDDIINDVSSTFSSLLSHWYFTEPVKPETAASIKKSVEIPQNIPTVAELSRLCRLRDTAFFNYMRSLERDIPEETSAFEPEHTHLVAADELTKPYLRTSINLKRALLAIDEEITTKLSAQRTWMDFIIETFFPSFVLKLMSYLTFQELIQAEREDLLKQHNAIIDELNENDAAFKQQWYDQYITNPPQDLSAASSTTLSKMLFEINNQTLLNVYLEYRNKKTVNTLLSLYRTAYQFHYQASQSDDLVVETAHLSGVLRQLEQLHPDMLDRLKQEKTIAQQEMELLDLYRKLPRVENRDKTKGQFLNELEQKYRAFLKTRNLENFKDLYQHIHSHHQAYRRETLVKKTRALLKKQYPEAYQAVRDHYIQHIDEKDCEAFLEKYEKRNFDHPVYTKIIAFMREPTLEALFTLKILMLSIQDGDYDRDQEFNDFIADFMQISSNIAVTSAAELRSERYATGSMSSIEIEDEEESMSTQSSNSPLPSASNSPRLRLSESALAMHDSAAGYEPKVFKSANRVYQGNDYALVPNSPR